MDLSEPTTPAVSGKLEMTGCAYASIVVVLLAGVACTVLFAAGAVYGFNLAGERRSGPATSILIKTPTFLAGPSIEMSLPAGSDLTSANIDTDGGNWWYDNADSAHLHLLIAASKISQRPPDVSTDYFRRVLRIVERSSDDQITAMGDIHGATVDSYSGFQATYDVEQLSGESLHAVALLIRREGDDLLIVLYGDLQKRDQLDRAATEMFRSLHPRPTPPQYDVHSARSSPTNGDRAIARSGAAVIRT